MERSQFRLYVIGQGRQSAPMFQHQLADKLTNGHPLSNGFLFQLLSNWAGKVDGYRS